MNHVALSHTRTFLNGSSSLRTSSRRRVQRLKLLDCFYHCVCDVFRYANESAVACLESLYVPRDTAASDKVLLTGERYCVVERRLQVDSSIAVERIVRPSRFPGWGFERFLRLEPDFFRESVSFTCREVVVESERWVRYAELVGGVLA